VTFVNLYICSSEQEKASAQWLECYTERRFQESLDNLIRKDVYIGQWE